MIRSMLIRIEEWVMDDPSGILSLAKLTFVIAVAMAMIVVPVYLLWGRTPSSRAITLDSAAWVCTASHQTTYVTAPVMAGKVMIPGHPVTQTICDQWTAK